MFMFPPLNSKWTFNAWAAAQIKVNPHRLPHARGEVTLAVRRGDAAHIRLWEMEKMLWIPYRELQSMISESTRPDPIREEILERFGFLGREVLFARIAGVPFPGLHTASLQRLTFLVDMVRSQLKGIAN